jgi:hypothetical protein
VEGSADAAEMAQVQQEAPVYPPLCNLGVVAAGVRERYAENANTKT